MKAIHVLATFALVASVFGRILDRCSLAREMHAMNIPKSELPIWTCIAEYESHFRTSAIGPVNWDGTRDYGLFQLNDKYWCQPMYGKFSYNICKTSCNNLLTDNISRSVSCARKVKSQQGWTAWSVYKPKCSGKLPSINNCF